MQRRLHPHVYCIVVALLGLTTASPPAQAQSPAAITAQQDPTAFAYTAPALIKELDTRYPFPPPVPPSPRPGGVLHISSWQQYGIWMWGVVHGDLGHSLTSRKPVSAEGS
jgi:ABC-type dipeptide/oligopeptide/nickel transport system permease component